MNPPQRDAEPAWLLKGYSCVLGSSASQHCLPASTLEPHPRAFPTLLAFPRCLPTHRVHSRELLAHHHDDDGDELPPKASVGAQAEDSELSFLPFRPVLLAHFLYLIIHVIPAPQPLQSWLGEEGELGRPGSRSTLSSPAPNQDRASQGQQCCRGAKPGIDTCRGRSKVPGIPPGSTVSVQNLPLACLSVVSHRQICPFPPPPPMMLYLSVLALRSPFVSAGTWDSQGKRAR